MTPQKLTLASLLFAAVFARAADPVLDPDASSPVANASNPGFIVRTVQAPDLSVLDNNFLRAIRQLDGTLLDSGGTPFADVSIPGPVSGHYEVATVDFTTDPFAGQQGYFPGVQQFPGPDAAVQKNLFATAVITY